MKRFLAVFVLVATACATVPPAPQPVRVVLVGTTDVHGWFDGRVEDGVREGGVAILGDPTSAVPEQNDLMTFGLSVARAMTTATELVGEVNGRLNLASDDPDPGAENRATLRMGGRYTRGSVRVDAAVLIGMTSRDPGIGLTTGFTWVLDAFQVP